MDLNGRVTALEGQFNENSIAYQNLYREVEDISSALQDLTNKLVEDATRDNILLEDRLRVNEESIRSMIAKATDPFLSNQEGNREQDISIANEIVGSSAPRPILLSYPWSLVQRLIHDATNSRVTNAMNASVHICYWHESQSRIVLKVFNTQKHNERESYESELNVATKLLDPNIIGIMGMAAGPIGQDDQNKRAIIYRYAERGSLQDNIGELDWQQVLSIFQDVASALAAVHQQDLVHRDIKPANILLTENYKAMLADFGSTKLDQTDYYSGTVGYVDKELVTGEVPVRARHDMYSLGISFLQVLTSRKFPINDSGPIRSLYEWVNDERGHGRSLVSKRLQKTGCNEKTEEKILDIMMTLGREPSDTRPTAFELVEDLKKLKEQGNALKKGKLKLSKLRGKLYQGLKKPHTSCPS